MSKSKKLVFETMPYRGPDAAPGRENFRFGTVGGVWYFNRASLDIEGIANNEPGNGHFEKCMQFIEGVAKEGKLPLRVVMITTEEFKAQLIEKYGFSETARANEVLKTSFLKLKRNPGEAERLRAKDEKQKEATRKKLERAKLPFSEAKKIYKILKETDKV